MEFDEFTDVSLDNSDVTYYHSFENDTEDSEESGIFSKSQPSSDQVSEKSTQSLVKPLVTKLYNDVTRLIDHPHNTNSDTTNGTHLSLESVSGKPGSDAVALPEHKDLNSSHLEFDVPNPQKSKSALTTRNSNGALSIRPSTFADNETEEQNAVRLKRFGSIDSQAESSTDGEESHPESHPVLEKQGSRSSIDELLFELYDKHHYSYQRKGSFSIDGSSTDCSSFSEYMLARSESEVIHYSPASLHSKDIAELDSIVSELTNLVNQRNSQLMKCLRNRERLKTKESKHCDMITAILQACSPKTSADSKMKFTIEPTSYGDANFDQWRDAVAALVRKPIGIPSHIRHQVWLALATDYINGLQLDWNKVVQFAFNDKSNPDDDALGAQIVKDLHRTGCSSFSGVENEDDRAILQRVLLGYARWNKVTGYCQGFNILAAVILEVTDKNEADALKTAIGIELALHYQTLLPTALEVLIVQHHTESKPAIWKLKLNDDEYFAHNLRALTVDMAVLRKYLYLKLPILSSHLVKLQEESVDGSTGANVEPPLTNVFTMQWFLTLFATCLPIESVLKIWDCVMIDGSEILIRTALALWTKLAKKIMRVRTADEFYMLMGALSHDLLRGKAISSDDIIKSVYSMAPLPLPKLEQFRERFMYDITPFNAALNSASRTAVYEDDGSDDIQELAKSQAAINNLPSKTYQTMNISLLKKQYSVLMKRQRQARVLMKGMPSAENGTSPSPHRATTVAMNHLFVGKELSESKRAKSAKSQPKSAAGNIEAYNDSGLGDERVGVQATTPGLSEELSTRLDLYATTQQGSGKQTFRYKYRKTTPAGIVQAPGVQAKVSDSDDRLEAAIREGLKKYQLPIEDNSSQITRGHTVTMSDNTEAKKFAKRQDSLSSTTSTMLSDDVFIAEQKLASTPTKTITRTSKDKSQFHTPQSVAYKQPFSPFPKPVTTGLLSAEKAKIGVRLGLYTAKDALSYMSPDQRRQFLSSGIVRPSTNFVSSSRSSHW